MIKIKNKSNCSGCHACVNACPKHCISMVPDDEGFLYPVVDKEKCIECGICKKICPYLKPLVSKNYPDAYACYNKNEDVRLLSSSGGMFTLFAEWILKQGGVVFGASYDEKLVVKHIFVDNIEDLDKLRGSKYVQSVIGETFRQAKEILQTGRLVLYTGTPCQINGLLLYLGKEYDNLYTQDIICHGVPSPKLWDIYLRRQEKLHNSKVDATKYPSFRSKVLGWLNFSMSIHFEKNIEYSESHSKDLFMKAFLGNLCLRPSCYKSNCKGLHRNSDITLADFWGVNNLMPDMFDDKGTSILLINTEKGKKLFDEIKDLSVYKKTDLKTAVKNNALVYIASPRPWNRNKFMRNMSSCDLEVLKNMCGDRSSFEKTLYRAKRSVVKYLNKLY